MSQVGALEKKSIENFHTKEGSMRNTQNWSSHTKGPPQVKIINTNSVLSEIPTKYPTNVSEELKNVNTKKLQVNYQMGTQ